MLTVLSIYNIPMIRNIATASLLFFMLFLMPLSAFAATRSLSLGLSGDDVRALQNELITKGYLIRSENQSPIRVETSIMFNDGDSGHPVFAPHGNILYTIGIGVEYKIATHRGRIIPLVLIAQDVKRKTKTDLLLLHKNFLENRQ